MTQNERHDQLTRRRALAAGASLAAAIAGCLGDDSDGADDEPGDDDPDDPDDSGDENGADDADGSDEQDDDAEVVLDDEPDDDEPDDIDGGDSLELLAEESVDHEHACLHAEFDEREPLEAGGSPEEAPSVDETHTIWEVAVEGEGYVGFDAAAHEHDGPFVFYTAGGSAEPVEGSEEERDDVPDDECADLEEYVQVDSEEGRIVLEVSPE